MLTGQSGYALPAKYRPLHRVSWRKACPFLEVQLPRVQRGGADKFYHCDTSAR